jgi:adenine-specific DNA-methyltransferase
LLSSYREKIKCIYIDPPYNVDGNYVYSDNWDEKKNTYWEHIGITESGVRIDTNNETDGRFHSNWLNMMYPRLLLARQLLKDDGIILISIDEKECYHLRKLCNEIFGEKNFCGEFIFDTNHSQQQGLIAIYHEYILVYSKKPAKEIDNFTGGEGEIVAGALKKISKGNPRSEFTFPAGVRCEAPDGTKFEGLWGDAETVELISGEFLIEEGKTKYPITLAAGWTQKTQMKLYFEGKDVIDTKGQKVLEFYFTSTGKVKCRKERSKITPNSILDKFGTISQATKYLDDLFEKSNVFPQPKPVHLIRHLIELVTNYENGTEYVLDFFAGSGTTFQAVMEINKEKNGNLIPILVQIPEQISGSDPTQKSAYEFCVENSLKPVISSITIERNKRVIQKIEKDGSEKQPDSLNQNTPPFKTGFKVYKLAKSNFPRIDFTPDPAKSEEENLALLNKYIEDKEAMFLAMIDEKNIFDEVLLKNGFLLNYSKSQEAAFSKNNIFRVKDSFKECLICMDMAIDKQTLKDLEAYKESIFICLERSLDTTMKWNLKHLLGDKLIAF